MAEAVRRRLFLPRTTEFPQIVKLPPPNIRDDVDVFGSMLAENKRADLFRAVYFHRTVRAIDLTLGDLFAESKALLFPGNPLEHLDQYLRFTDWSLLVDVAGWPTHADPARRRNTMCAASEALMLAIS